MNCNNTYIYKGDDTGAFGATFLTVNASIPTGYNVSKAEIKIGILDPIVIENPEFPLSINLTSEQTALLMDKNSIYMAVYDDNNLKKTCKGVITFKAREQII